MIVKLLTEPFGVSKLKRRLQRLIRVYTCQNVKLLWLMLYSMLHYLAGPWSIVPLAMVSRFLDVTVE